MNNTASNIALLCPKHHIHADRLPLLRRIAGKGGRSRAAFGLRDVGGRFCKEPRIESLFP